MQDLRYLPGVTTLHLEPELCVGCGMCHTVCPHGVFAPANGKAEIVDRDGCMECGACAMNCPVTAISLTPGVGCASYIIKRWLKGRNKDLAWGSACC